MQRATGLAVRGFGQCPSQARIASVLHPPACTDLAWNTYVFIAQIKRRALLKSPLSKRGCTLAIHFSISSARISRTDCTKTCAWKDGGSSSTALHTSSMKMVFHQEAQSQKTATRPSRTCLIAPTCCGAEYTLWHPACSKLQVPSHCALLGRQCFSRSAFQSCVEL